MIAALALACILIVHLPQVPAEGWLAALACCLIGAVVCAVKLRKPRP